MRRGKIRKKLYRFTYDKPGINKKALQISRSVEEVKKLLEAWQPKEKKERKGKKR